jgi:tRNA A-37 threonylcarbamoyl transferase component Bud32
MVTMNRENPGKENLAEREELAKKFVEQIIEESQFTDAGAEGLVYRLDEQAISKDFEEFLKAQGVEAEGDIASKILKVYTRGQGATEFAALQKMWNLIKSLTDSAGFAKVPKPIFLQEIPVTESLKKALSQKRNEIIGSKVEVILMDFIEGDDFSMTLYKKALEIIQKDDFSPESTEGMDFQSLTRYVQDEYSRRNQAAPERIEGPLGDDASWLQRLLKENGYLPDPSIIQQIKKTVELMQKKGISHGDLHPRNIKIDNGQVYLLDFGKADGSWENMSDEDKKERIGDTVLLEWLKSFSQNSQKEFKNKAANYLRDLKKISQKPKISQKFESLRDKLSANPREQLWLIFDRLNMTDDDIDEFCSIIYRLTQESPETVSGVTEFLKESISKGKGPAVVRFELVLEAVLEA